jgi:uncharacterized Zn-binding protein involved in type VI secretion
MPVVARKTDTTRCPEHGQGRIAHGLDEVLICFKPVARKGDAVLCQDGSADVIVEGCSTVWIGGRQVACKGHHTAHGAIISSGCPRVFIGVGLRDVCKLRAAAARTAFIRRTVRKRPVPLVTPAEE